MKINSHYVDNSRLTNELSSWTNRQRKLEEQGIQKEKVPDYIAECIVKICENIVRKPNFYSYTYRDEMVGDAIMYCIMYVGNFDSKKSSNAFAYISQVAFTAIVRRIKKEKLTSTRHLQFIKNIVGVEQLTEALSSVSGVERKYYDECLNGIKNLIDDIQTTDEEFIPQSDIDESEEESEQADRPKTILEILMEEEGIPLL